MRKRFFGDDQTTCGKDPGGLDYANRQHSGATEGNRSSSNCSASTRTRYCASVRDEGPIGGDGSPLVGFDKLASYNFDVPDDEPVTNKAAGPDKADDQIPSTVKAFNQKKVFIKGFMLPLKVENGAVTEFLILKGDQSMCCYGNVPKITEWVSVKTASKGIKPVMDQPVSIEGTLHVGAMRENGYLVGIYQMDGEKMVEGN